MKEKQEPNNANVYYAYEDFDLSIDEKHGEFISMASTEGHIEPYNVCKLLVSKEANDDSVLEAIDLIRMDIKSRIDSKRSKQHKKNILVRFFGFFK